MQKSADTPIESKDYPLLGRILAKTDPSAALAILQPYKEAQATALDTNIKNLNEYFLIYCEINHLRALDYVGPLYKSEKVEKRRLFIGAMLRTYKPQMISYDFNAENGLATTLCSVLNMEPGNMSKEIHQTILLIADNLYDYTNEVQQIAERLILKLNERRLGPSLFEQLEESA